MNIVKEGNTVELDYTGKFENGEIFDSSKHGDHSHPLKFVVGSGEVIPGFDNAVKGMKEGEEKEFEISPKEGYGEYNSDLVREVPRKFLPKDHEPQVGMALMMRSPEGMEISAMISKVCKESVTLDLNHPLAGKKLIFNIKLIKIE